MKKSKIKKIEDVGLYNPQSAVLTTPSELEYVQVGTMVWKTSQI